MRICLPLLGVCLLLTRTVDADQTWQTSSAFAAPEAFQAAAASPQHVFAISSRNIGKYTRGGKRLAVSTGDAKHLNSGFLWKGRLLCAHSNYPSTPEQSDIKVLDPETMKLTTHHRFGDIGGSLTWVVRHHGSWWCNFAKYGAENGKTFLVQFDNEWREQARWTYPKSVIGRLGAYSLSGGVWHATRFNGSARLVVTGHDKPELYELRLPASGSVLEHVRTFNAPFYGQGMATDPVTGGLIGIQRSNRRIVFATPPSTHWVQMPLKGICAHRGASDTHPENTIAAFQEAIRLGAHMIELDVAFSKDKRLVLMHDSTLDRTTDGAGPVGARTLEELKGLDAGSWKGPEFRGQRVPTFAEALAMMPENIWLNVHLKGGAELAVAAAKDIAEFQRNSQAFLACGAAAAKAARAANPDIQICNMERQSNAAPYIQDTIAKECEFIQLLGGDVAARDASLLQRNHVRINYCCVNDQAKLQALLLARVEFPLVDKLDAMLQVAESAGIPRWAPSYRSRLQIPWEQRPLSTVRHRQTLEAGAAGQGLAVGEDDKGKERYYTSNATSICEYDSEWRHLRTKTIRIEGVNHLGAIDFHDGFLWAGLLSAPHQDVSPPRRSMIAKIRASDLQVVQTWDLTKDMSWIDPVCFDGERLWVGDLSDLGIHCYQLQGGGDFQRIGTLRYPRQMHFSQGLRVRGNKLYSIHTFGSMDGLFEFEIPQQWERQQQPLRVWHIPDSHLHLEGFAFAPGSADEILHAQGSVVDRIQLHGLSP